MGVIDTRPLIIDVDTHLTEPHDLWITRAPAQWRDRVPQVKEVDGGRHWVIDGQILGTTRASSIIHPDLTKGTGMEALNLRYDEVHPASYEVESRVALMDTMGIYAQIIYPNLLGFGGVRVSKLDPALKLLTVQIYNDAMAEFQERSGRRLFGMALLPWWDLKQAVAEAKRCHAMGIRGVNINPEPQQQGFPDLGEDFWRPLFETCSDLGLPINFHIGASEDQQSWWGDAPWPSLHPDRKLAIGSSTLHMQNARVIANLIYSGVCERHANLKFVSVESGVGWLPFMLEALDYYATQISPSVTADLSLSPTEYFRRQIYSCFWFESRHIADTVRQLGEDNILFETDFPHSCCLYPNAAERVAASLKELPITTRDKLLYGNAAQLYRIPVPAKGANL